MMNQLIMVGRLTSDPEIKATGNKKAGYITLAVPRSYKNEDGEYETDFIDCVLWGTIAEKTVEYCHKGDLIGVRGRLQSTFIENEDGTKTKTIEVTAEKITFLSSKKEEQKENE